MTFTQFLFYYIDVLGRKKIDIAVLQRVPIRWYIISIAVMGLVMMLATNTVYSNPDFLDALVEARIAGDESDTEVVAMLQRGYAILGYSWMLRSLNSLFLIGISGIKFCFVVFVIWLIFQIYRQCVFSWMLFFRIALVSVVPIVVGWLITSVCYYHCLLIERGVSVAAVTSIQRIDGAIFYALKSQELFALWFVVLFGKRIARTVGRGIIEYCGVWLASFLIISLLGSLLNIEINFSY